MAGRDREGIKEQEAIAQEALKYVRGNRLFKVKKENGDYSKKTENMVLDLAKRFPELARHRIAEVLGINVRYVRRLVEPKQTAKADRHQNNIRVCNEHLAALQSAHPGRRYEDDPRAKTESRAWPVVVNNDAAHYKADQSHTIKRPITLPTKPFDIAA